MCKKKEWTKWLWRGGSYKVFAILFVYGVVEWLRIKYVWHFVCVWVTYVNNVAIPVWATLCCIFRHLGNVRCWKNGRSCVAWTLGLYFFIFYVIYWASGASDWEWELLCTHTTQHCMFSQYIIITCSRSWHIILCDSHTFTHRHTCLDYTRDTLTIYPSRVGGTHVVVISTFSIRLRWIAKLGHGRGEDQNDLHDTK